MYEIFIEEKRITRGEIIDLLSQPLPYYTSGEERLSTKDVLDNLEFFLYKVDGTSPIRKTDHIVFYDHNIINLLLQGIRFKKLNFNIYRQGEWYY